jgi:hypothetical protein
MAMKSLTHLPARLFLIALLGVATALAQQDDGVRGAQETIRNDVSVSESFLGPGLEMGGLVTGQPYSADQVSERKQTLTNGTHIDQKRELSRMYRDSDGRTRTERRAFLATPRNNNSPETDARFIHIYDPIAGYSYTLDTQKRIAHRFTVPIPSQLPKTVRMAGTFAPVQPGQQAARKPMGSNSVLQRRQMNKESLGSDVIDGIQVEGERLTVTTPAGVVGNDRPLTRVCEHWRSEELKLTILSKCSDPRFGNSTVRLQNLDRAEPDPALFQVPADYEIVEETGPFVVGFGQTAGVR